jgi:hypothetical protein
MEDAMAKALGVNDSTVQNQERQPQQQSGDKQKLQGKALQVNENSVEDQEPLRSPAPSQPGSSGDEPNQQKLQGNAFQVNENSVEDQEPVRSPPAPPRRG